MIELQTLIWLSRQLAEVNILAVLDAKRLRIRLRFVMQGCFICIVMYKIGRVEMHILPMKHKYQIASGRKTPYPHTVSPTANNQNEP